MVGCEKPKKSAPEGTMGTTDFELREGHIERVFQRDQIQLTWLSKLTSNPEAQSGYAVC